MGLWALCTADPRIYPGAGSLWHGASHTRRQPPHRAQPAPDPHRANFTNIDVEAVASDSSTRGVADYLQHIHPDRMQSLVKAGLLTEEQLVGYSAALDTYLATPDAYTLWLSLLVCGEKPLVA
ncbi:MAG: hypothetical protein R2867_25300 [Caldilineaceae bacterium]